MAHLALLLSAASLPTSSGILPFAKSFDSLVAYYVFDDGAGFDLKESVSNVSNAGRVLYESKHQTVNYTQPNWSEDEYFGTVIACGSKDTEQKDTLELADVDYADASGAFTINVWYRHDEDDHANASKEQFFGHGDPSQLMPTANQVHVMFERGGADTNAAIRYYEESGTVRTILYDADDPAQDSGCAYCTSLGLALNETDASMGEECGSNPNCWGPFRGLTDTLPSEHGAIDSDNMWHMLTLTTHPEGGNGYSVYIDGMLRSSTPFKNAGVDNFDWRLRGGASVCYECAGINPAYRVALQDRSTPGMACTGDDDAAAGRLAAASGMPASSTCADVKSFCGLSTVAESCCVTCAAPSSPSNVTSDAPCEDDDAGLASVAGQFGITGCAMAADYCTGSYSSIIEPYCKVTCGTCGAAGGSGPNDDSTDWTPVREFALNASERAQFATGGGPINPKGPMRFCGRMAKWYGGSTQGYWADEEAHGLDLGWHEYRYFMGKIAHASFYSQAMTPAEIKQLMQSYEEKYFPREKFNRAFAEFLAEKAALQAEKDELSADKASLNTTVATQASYIKELQAELYAAERKEKCLAKCDANHAKCRNYCSSCHS